MGCPDNSPSTFVLKLNLHCNFCGGCVKEVKKIVRHILGVDSIDINTEEGVAIISGRVDPHIVIKALEKDKKINAELVGEEKSLPNMSIQELQIHGVDDSINAKQGKAAVSGEEESLPKINKQELQIHEVDDSINAKQGKAAVSGEEESLPKINKQELQIVLPKNHVRKIRNQHKVVPQPDLIIKSKDKIIQKSYPKHEHELELKSYNKPFNCNGCKEDGFRLRYRCEPCNHDCHEECVSPKPTITHELFEGSTFVFSEKPGNTCDACGREIYGYSYHCKEDNLDLHPRCANLRGKLCIGGTDFVLQKKAKDKCFWCKKKRPNWLADDKILGWCYVSKHNKFYCHVYCVSQMVHEAWRRGNLDRKEDDDDASMALERLDLELVTNMEKRGGRGGTAFLKKVCILLRTVLGILFGDPTVLVFSMLVEVVSK